MNHPVDVHPEDLLDREQANSLTVDERRRLDAHTAKCASCALLRSASVDFARERAAASGDDQLAERIVAGALGATLSAPPVSRGYIMSRPRRPRGAWAAAAAVLLVATGATASLWSVRRVLMEHLLMHSATSAPNETKNAARPTPPAPPRAITLPSLPLPSDAPADEVVPPPAPVILPPAPREAPAASRPKIDEAPVLTADKLFAAATEARHRGDSAQAIKLYQNLQRQFSGSREEIASRVMLGRLLLDRGEDPGHTLALFTRYLDAAPSGTLAEEARLGRALSLQRLGRPAEERQAWHELLSAHPNTIHAERAHRRLDELR